MKKIVLGIVCAALMFAPPVFAQKKSLVVGMGSADAGKLDPHIASTTPDKGLLSWMFNGLVRVRPGRISPEFIEPDLAESYVEPGRHRVDVQDPRRRAMPPWLRRIHGRRRRVFDQASQQQGDILVFQ